LDYSDFNQEDFNNEINGVLLRPEDKLFNGALSKMIVIDPSRRINAKDLYFLVKPERYSDK